MNGDSVNYTACAKCGETKERLFFINLGGEQDVVCRKCLLQFKKLMGKGTYVTRNDTYTCDHEASLKRALTWNRPDIPVDPNL